MFMNRAKLRRWHIWLGWAAAIPVLVWIISGLVMVARPTEGGPGTKTSIRTQWRPGANAYDVISIRNGVTGDKVVTYRRVD